MVTSPDDVGGGRTRGLRRRQQHAGDRTTDHGGGSDADQGPEPPLVDHAVVVADVGLGVGRRQGAAAPAASRSDGGDALLPGRRLAFHITLTLTLTLTVALTVTPPVAVARLGGAVGLALGFAV